MATVIGQERDRLPHEKVPVPLWFIEFIFFKNVPLNS